MKRNRKQYLLIGVCLAIAYQGQAQIGVPIGTRAKIKSKIEQEVKKNTGSANQETTDKKSGNRDAYYARIEAENVVDEFIKSSEPSEEMIQKVLAVNKSIVDFNKWRHYTVEQAEKVDYIEKSLKTRLKNTGSSSFTALQSVKQYWTICADFYPDEAKVLAARDRINNLAKEMGMESKEDYNQAVASREEKRISDKRMPKANRTDKATEDLFRKAFNSESKRTNWDRTILKINLRNGDWIIEYHKVSGAILGRKQYAAIVYKDNKTGECRLSEAYGIYQEYTGNGYSDLKQQSQPAGGQFKCGNENLE